ncbi:MAG TPA: histidine kinase N-terminal domain-containing protein, partial [Ilumatobacteraceae bacterium]|nr:histidine kinase N-terminal domain-containing protein [Ilumatobacteraceae bacterium]
MATLGELTRQHTQLNRDEVDHLQRLIGEWGLLADLSFADLLLYVPGTDGTWYVVAHVRPATGQTIYHYDYVGTAAAGQEVPLLSKAYTDGEIVEGELVVEGMPDPVRMMAVPVRDGDHAIAVLTREWSSRSSRQPGELERTYVGMFQRFASMIAEGSFPFQGPVADSSAAPRVGDGVMALDEEARVRFASPNAVSALHRVGIGANAVGMRLAELGFNDSPVRRAYETKLPVIEEFEQTSDVILLVRCMPVLATGVGHDSAVTGGLLLVRDVTEVRKRDKLLLSKDATIRE